MNVKYTLTSLFLFAFFFLICSTQVSAIEDPTARPNNKFGIHILFPSEIEQAASLVNSNGGDWGHVIIPIQSTDRNLEKWQKFMDEARRLHVIPIIRIATYVEGNAWTKPTIFDHLDFAHFLNSLTWPTKNRYVVVYNEPNSNLEWGGLVDPAHYADELNRTIDVFKSVSEDFFIISAGLDVHAPNRGTLYQSSTNYLFAMNKAVPGIFKRIDGFASHSYPSRNFTANPVNDIKGGVTVYREELTLLRKSFGRESIPILITETGWRHDIISQDQAASFYRYAFENLWNDKNIVAITPFLLNGQGSLFGGFSLMRDDGSPSEIYNVIASLPKVKGQPHVVSEEKIRANIKYPVYIKNLDDVDASLPDIGLTASLRTIAKWFLVPE